MKLFKKENWVVSFKNEWLQIGRKFNWYSFTLINICFENEVYTGGVEFEIVLLGFRLFIRYNYGFEESEVGKIVKKYEKQLCKKSKKTLKS